MDKLALDGLVANKRRILEKHPAQHIAAGLI
jgi:hypothetical protein